MGGGEAACECQGRVSIRGSGASPGSSNICCVQRTATRLAVLGEFHVKHNCIRALSHHVIHMQKKKYPPLRLLANNASASKQSCTRFIISTRSHLHPSHPSLLPLSKPPSLSPSPLVYASTNAQTPPHPLPNNLLKLLPPIPPHLRRLNIRRALIIRFRQHTHHTNQNLLHTLYRRPPLAGFFIVVRIIAWCVEDGDADDTCWVDCDCPSAHNSSTTPSHQNADLLVPQGPNIPFGCHTSLVNRILGGLSG